MLTISLIISTIFGADFKILSLSRILLFSPPVLDDIPNAKFEKWLSDGNVSSSSSDASDLLFGLFGYASYILSWTTSFWASYDSEEELWGRFCSSYLQAAFHFGSAAIFTFTIGKLKNGEPGSLLTSSSGSCDFESCDPLGLSMS